MSYRAPDTRSAGCASSSGPLRPQRSADPTWRPGRRQRWRPGRGSDPRPSLRADTWMGAEAGAQHPGRSVRRPLRTTRQPPGLSAASRTC